MQIDNLIIDVPMIAVLNELKRQLAFNDIKLLNKMFDSGDDVMVCCPYHKNGQERRPSAGIRKSDGLFHCLACGETHSLPELIAHCFGSNDKLFGHKWLLNNFVTAEIEEREDILVDVRRFGISSKRDIDDIAGISDNNSKRNSRTYISEEELDGYRYIHNYMYDRGLNDDVIDLFDIGYDVKSTSITFPVKDSAGNCLFIARRSIHSKYFDLPKGIDKPLYGLRELEQLGDYEDVYICEGVFDCLRFWCNGKPAVAGFGCLYNELQMSQLRDLKARHLIDALDNDAPGREGAKRIRRAVKNKIFTSIVYPKGKKDPGELTDEEIQNLEETF